MTEVNKQMDTSELSETDVVSFLRENPDFFVNHEYLLSEIKLPHQSGSAISLGERQVQVFREHRDALKQQLNELIGAARQNDRLFEKSKRLLLDMLEVNTLDEIEYVIKAAFNDDDNVDFARIVVFGSADEYPASNLHIVNRDTAKEALGTLVDSQSAVCGRFTDKQLAFLYQDQAGEVSSAAVMPLRNEQLLGFFTLGSKNPDHFDSSMGSLFLSYISDFVARILPDLLMRSKAKGQTDAVPSLLD